jgi:hypothetical protein
VEGDMRKGIVYYTDNKPSKNFLAHIRNYLRKAAGDIPIVWVSQKPIPEKNNIVMDLKRCHRSRCLQILTGIRKLDVDIIYLAEHDVIYHRSHFEFVPAEEAFYYNTNKWWLRSEDGQASHKETKSLSQLVAFKELMNDFFTRRVYYYTIGKKIACSNEPGKSDISELPKYRMGTFKSEIPNIDIRHKHNFTKSNKFKPSFILSDEIPGWGKTKGNFARILKGA